MRFRALIISILFILFAKISRAQESMQNFEEILLELLGEELSEDVDISDIIEKLIYYQKHPIDLNTADEQILGELQFLNAQQIANILAHRRVSGNFISLLELQSIRGLDLTTITFLEQFVSIGNGVSTKMEWDRILADSEQNIMLRFGRVLEEQRGYSITDESRSRYLGDPNRYAIRYRLNYDNRFKIAINSEKDAGEPFFREQQRYGFDFYSGSVEWSRPGQILQKAVIGDMALQFGQGLIAWNGLSFGKGSQLQNIARQAQGIRSYTSLNENNYLRGLAFNLQWNGWEIKPFIARNKLSGKVILGENDEQIITTISTSGLHRTPTEQGYRRAIGQWVWGSHLSYNPGRFKFGATYMSTKFDGTVQRGVNLYQLYDFQGDILHQFGVNYQFNYRNYYVFGETAFNHDFALATNNGIIAALDPKITFIAHYRNYQKDYHHYYGRAMGETSSLSNECGILAGLQYSLIRRLEWTNYVDFFSFPWLRYRVDAPSRGVDLLSQLTYSWHKKGKLTLRYRYRLREENAKAINQPENFLAQIFRNQLRADFQFKLDETWSIRSRAEWSRYDKELSHSSRGYLLYQDLFWKSSKNRITSNVRLAHFNTNDYDARIYAYESDVLYGASFPMYYDRGWRYYLNLRYRLSKSIDLWARFAQTVYQDRETVGSALDLIEGNKKSDIKLQLRWQW